MNYPGSGICLVGIWTTQQNNSKQFHKNTIYFSSDASGLKHSVFLNKLNFLFAFYLFTYSCAKQPQDVKLFIPI